MPLLVYYVLSDDLDPGYRVGLLLTSMAPTGIIMLAISRFVPYKDYNLILSNFLFTTFGSILYIPIMVEWLVGAAVQFKIVHLFFRTAVLVLIPYGVSEIIKRFLPANTAAMFKRHTQGVMLMTVFITIGVSISAASQELVWDQALMRLALLVLSIFFLQGGLGYLAGLMFWDKSVRNTLAMIASSRNSNFILGIAIMNFPPIAAVPCILAIIFHHTTNAFWVWLFRK
jgi:predicted Na+-dependent transporter